MDLVEVKANGLSLSTNTIGELYPRTAHEVEERVTEAVEKIKPMTKTLSIFGRSHTDAQWNLFVVGSEHSLVRRFRQVCAEIKNKRDAIVTNSYSYKKMLLEAKIKEEEAEFANGSKKELLLVEAEEIRMNARTSNDYIVGATKDINQLAQTYDLIKAEIIEKHGSFSEEVLEKEERRYWVKRGFSQSMRDFRQHGTISKGEQGLLENIGVEPTEARLLIANYQKFVDDNIAQGKTIDPSCHEEFLEMMADKFESRAGEAIEKYGFTTEHLEKE